MYYLIFSICFAASLPLLFKFFGSRAIQTVYVVPINYLACAIVGIILGDAEAVGKSLTAGDWVGFAVGQGIFFAINFYLLAAATQRLAVSVAALSSRLAVAIPVMLAFPLYGDSLTLLKLVGLLGTAIALYLASTKGPTAVDRPQQNFALLPIMLFIGSGLNWALLKYVQQFYLQDSSYHAYVTMTFTFAFVASSLAACFQPGSKRLFLRAKVIIGGAILGVCNYLTVYFLVRALSSPGAESSRVYPIYGVGVLIVSSLFAYLFMGESCPARRFFGLMIGVAAIILLNL